MLDYVKNKLSNIANALDSEALAEKVFDQDEVKEQMIRLNQHQMFDQGIDSKNDSLGDYSTVSVQKYGKPPGHIRLYDTGEFYDSMEVVTSGDQAVIEGDMLKPDRDLSIAYPNALGLNEESISELRDTAKGIIQQEIRDAF